VFAVVSRQALVESRFSSVVCAPVYSRRDGLTTQVDVGIDEGLKHESSIHCDALVSLAKTSLTDYVASLGPTRLRALDEALRIALAID
jgi:mRNA interferase MazF